MDNNTLEMAKRRVSMLAGKDMIIKVNKGRNKFVEYSGTIDSVYPSIFTVNATIENENKILSYSYNDVLTKAVRFYPPKPKENTLA